jgi:hypothetical protein
MKLYKIIQDNKSFHGGSFDWTPYLPKENGDPGDWTPEVESSECNSGYHVTPYPNMWWADCAKAYEVEVRGMADPLETVGVVDKRVCCSIRLIREVNPGFVDGHRNTGNWNTGLRNTGHRNTGLRNTGHRNTGDWNTGDWNTGLRNTGHRNTGDWNTGDWNTGDWNTGDRNTGYRNTGDWNTGDRNTGLRNTGHRNTGNWNTGDWNTGFFNTTAPKFLEVFEKPLPYDEAMSIQWPSWFGFDLKDDYLGSWKKAFDDSDPIEVEAATKLPNFDYAIFEKVSGITRSMIEQKIKESNE